MKIDFHVWGSIYKLAWKFIKKNKKKTKLMFYRLILDTFFWIWCFILCFAYIVLNSQGWKNNMRNISMWTLKIFINKVRQQDIDLQLFYCLCQKKKQKLFNNNSEYLIKLLNKIDYKKLGKKQYFFDAIIQTKS